ncbi:hypothetical protein FQA47_024534 [Oryzias melastigma]|uniref:Uncharacterized protein n=1 Tax=Oryzias melastigma TaxID=30732 RepID=A0A834KYN0_ORYME|nr:hypothetical protein FQA47_024534 [Oryzias melastigma]
MSARGACLLRPAKVFRGEKRTLWTVPALTDPSPPRGICMRTRQINMFTVVLTAQTPSSLRISTDEPRDVHMSDLDEVLDEVLDESVGRVLVRSCPPSSSPYTSRTEREQNQVRLWNLDAEGKMKVPASVPEPSANKQGW